MSADTAAGRAGDNLAARFARMWAELEPVGRRADGGVDRFAWTPEDLELRAWFRRAAGSRSMSVEQDRNGNLWAWWGPGREGAVITGSHLDSVPGGGLFDGPLGIVGGFLAVDELRGRRAAEPDRPVAVVDFADEEGARFGVACLGSRLSTGALDPGRARALTGVDGITLADAMAAAGADPAAIGPDPDRLAAASAYVELHIEQGRGLADLEAPVGVASEIWPHGRWRLSFDGEANHAGTARLEDRHDPVLPFAAAVTAAREAATGHGGLATIGRAELRPNATNGVAASVVAWLDARAPDEGALGRIVADVRVRAEAVSAEHGVRLTVREESMTPAVAFSPDLRRRIATVLGSAPEIATGAGHDAGILSRHLPAAMLFVRNPTGVSHSPAEHASAPDCVEGIRALAAVLEELAWD